MKEKTLNLAQEWGLDEVTITQGRNGYPEGLYKALIGFDYFENAEDFAEQVGGEVVLLTKRDGHQFWEKRGRAYEGIERAKFIDEDRYDVFSSELDFEEWCVGEIEHRMNMGFDLFEFKDMIEQMCDTYEDIRTRWRDEIAIVDTRDYTCETTEEYVTKIHDNDVTTYAIAVIDGDSEEETEEEED